MNTSLQPRVFYDLEELVYRDGEEDWVTVYTGFVSEDSAMGMAKTGLSSSFRIIKVVMTPTRTVVREIP